MDYKPKISLEIDSHLINYKFFEALKCISRTWSQRKAAAGLNISHAVLNRRVKEVEDKLNFQIVETTPRGSGLTPEGMELLERYESYENRLKKRDKIVIGGGFISSNLVGSLASSYGLESVTYSTDDENALHLFDMDMLDILTLDDPIYAFKNDLKFNPIAYDYLDLIASSKESLQEIDDINHLKRKKFVSVPNSSQRLAWNTLDNSNIDYRIVEKVKNPFEAFKTVKYNENLYTFLNSSFFPGSDVIKEETKHIISLVIVNEHAENLKDFLEYILGEGQQIVEKKGFDRVR